MDALALAGEYLFIFAARLTDVTLSTVRFMLMMRGLRLAAAGIGLVEIAVWILALGRVLEGLNNPVKLALYCLGFASGIYAGQWVEAKLAIGVATLHIICSEQSLAADVAASLRALGCGVTVLTGEGRGGPRQVLLVTVQRKGLDRVVGEAKGADPQAFITVLDARTAYGGTLAFRK